MPITSTPAATKAAMAHTSVGSSVIFIASHQQGRPLAREAKSSTAALLAAPEKKGHGISTVVVWLAATVIPVLTGLNVTALSG
jgi:hypothetical protein